MFVLRTSSDSCKAETSWQTKYHYLRFRAFLCLCHGRNFALRTEIASLVGPPIYSLFRRMSTSLSSCVLQCQSVQFMAAGNCWWCCVENWEQHLLFAEGLYYILPSTHLTHHNSYNHTTYFNTATVDTLATWSRYQIYIYTRHVSSFSFGFQFSYSLRNPFLGRARFQGHYFFPNRLSKHTIWLLPRRA